MSAFQNFNPNGWFVLDFMSAIISPSTGDIGMSAAPPEWLAITERNAIRWTFILAYLFGLVAMALSILGEAKNEKTLFTAASSFFGFGAISVINVWGGLLCLTLTSGVVFYIRSKRVSALTKQI
ncbi:membrane protein [Beggiatoa sp. PS]|nr:membrane protein [Beggiatoa sp. PS]